MIYIYIKKNKYYRCDFLVALEQIDFGTQRNSQRNSTFLQFCHFCVALFLPFWEKFKKTVEIVEMKK